jgi:hypothetical protein
MNVNIIVVRASDLIEINQLPELVTHGPFAHAGPVSLDPTGYVAEGSWSNALYDLSHEVALAYGFAVGVGKHFAAEQNKYFSLVSGDVPRSLYVPQIR